MAQQVCIRSDAHTIWQARPVITTNTATPQDAASEQARAAAEAARANQLQAVLDAGHLSAGNIEGRRSSLSLPADRRRSGRRTGKRVSIVKEETSAAYSAPRRSTQTVPAFRP